MISESYDMKEVTLEKLRFLLRRRLLEYEDDARLLNFDVKLIEDKYLKFNYITLEVDGK